MRKAKREQKPIKAKRLRQTSTHKKLQVFQESKIFWRRCLSTRMLSQMGLCMTNNYNLASFPTLAWTPGHCYPLPRHVSPGCPRGRKLGSPGGTQRGSQRGSSTFFGRLDSRSHREKPKAQAARPMENKCMPNSRESK